MILSHALLQPLVPWIIILCSLLCRALRRALVSASHGLCSACTDSCILTLASQYIPVIQLPCFYCLTMQCKLDIQLSMMQCLASIAWQYILANLKWVYIPFKACENRKNYKDCIFFSCLIWLYINPLPIGGLEGVAGYIRVYIAIYCLCNFADVASSDNVA